MGKANQGFLKEIQKPIKPKSSSPIFNYDRAIVKPERTDSMNVPLRQTRQTKSPKAKSTIGQEYREMRDKRFGK